MDHDIIHESSTVEERARVNLITKTMEMCASGWGPLGGVNFLKETTGDGETMYHFVQAVVKA